MLHFKCTCFFHWYQGIRKEETDYEISFPDFPFLNRPRLGGEAHTHFHHLTGIRFILTGIPFLFNLLQRFGSRAIQLKFKDIHILRCLHDTIHPTFTLRFFHQDRIDAHQAEQQIEGVLEIALPFRFVFLAPHGIGNAGQKRGQHLAEVIQFTIFQSKRQVLCQVTDILIYPAR